MSGNRHQLGQSDSGTHPDRAVVEELHSWIERVIVPALVSRFLQEAGPNASKLMDNADSVNTVEEQDAAVSHPREVID